MITGYDFNVFTGKLDIVGKIPELTADPASPKAEDAWVLKTTGGGSGGGKIIAPLGLGFIALTPDTGSSDAYKFSYRNKDGTTRRFTLT